jgi:hypothetical protein
MTWQADTPFNQLPLLPPTADVVDSVAVLKACIPARAALAELKQAGALLPNQGLLTITGRPCHERSFALSHRFA